MTRDPYEQRLAERVNRIAPGAYEGLSEIRSLPEKQAERILRELLETGCLSQHCANMEAARRAVLRLPPDWVTAHLPKVVPACLFQEAEWREWEFRQAAELLRDAFPDACRWLTEYAAGLGDPEVEEAIRDQEE